MSSDTIQQLDKIFRKFSLDKLEAIKAIVDSSEDFITTTTISGVLIREGQQLGGTLSSLTRTNLDGEPLVQSVGKSSDEGLIWKLNTNFASKNNIQEVVDKIWKENRSFRMAQKNSET